jgi:fatty acid amide hydrolase 2
MPAFFNGVFGHKATGGLIPGTGNFPTPHGDAWRLLSTGPLCRKAEDLGLLVRLLVGPDGQDPGCEPGALLDPEAVRASDLTVYDCRERLLLPVESELLEAQERAARALERRGATVRRTALPALRDALELWSARMHAAGGPSYAELLGEGTAIATGRELAKWLLGRSEHTLPSLGLAAVEKVPSLFPGRIAKMVERARRLQGELRELLGDRGVLLFPSHTRVAPKHHRPVLPPVHWAYTGIFNALEAPSTQVPLGLGRRGLPLGVQVVAGHGRDHLGLAVARMLEEDFGGWVSP